MNQVVLGASFAYVVGVVVYICRGFRASLRLLLLTPLGMAAGALWAILPDLPRAVGWHSLYARLANDPRTDIFLWHYTIDRIETDTILNTPVFVLMVLSLLAAAWRELRLREGG